MASLAVLSDVQARFPEFDPGTQGVLATTLLDAASARVRRYCRRAFTEGSKTGERGLSDGTLTLREQPVVDVSEVRLSSTSSGLTGWTLAGGTIVGLPVGEVEVDYTYGTAAAPADVVDVVANAVVRRLQAGVSPGLRSVTVGGVSETYEDGASSGSLVFTADDYRVLDSYRLRRLTFITL